VDLSSATRENAKKKKNYSLGVWTGRATPYGLDGPEIESRWRLDFPYLSGPALRNTQPPIQGVPGLSWE